MHVLDLISRKIKRRVKRVKQTYAWMMQNRLARKRILEECSPASAPIKDLCRYEAKYYSQHGEDGILLAIFAKIGSTNKYTVEFGVGTGKECNTRHLIQRKQWKGLWMTANDFPRRRWQEIQCEFITAENINELFEKYSVPREFDLLNIDIDGNDLWVWKKIESYRPRVVCIEYNGNVPCNEARSIAYDPTFNWAHTAYFGASLRALELLAVSKGYVLVGCDSSGTNAFFVDRPLAGHFVPQDLPALFRAPLPARSDPRTMIEVTF